MSAEGASVSFKHDYNDMCAEDHEAVVVPEITKLYHHGKLLPYMTVNYKDFDEVTHQDNLLFFYDPTSRPAKVEFNGTVYTYLHNLHGDIAGILDAGGSLVVEYKYGALGKRNPPRYRKYVFDEEAELYDLYHRCYVHGFTRFINTDNFCGSAGHLNTHALNVYCKNNPIAMSDQGGKAAISTIPATA